MDNHSEHIVKASEVINKNVYDSDFNHLGTIEEIVLDKESGYARYVVLSFGGILNFGNKLFPFPWHAISYCLEKEGFILNIPKEKLQKEHGFDKDNWPDTAGWANALYERYR